MTSCNTVTLGALTSYNTVTLDALVFVTQLLLASDSYFMRDDPNDPNGSVKITHSGAIDLAKPMKGGRPKLPAGTAKGRIVHVRFTPEEIERINELAKASNKTVSEWIRSTLNAASES